MYLEISGRYCGKTERLINFAISKARNGNRVLISARSCVNASSIKNRIREKVAQDVAVVEKCNHIYSQVLVISLIDVVDKCIDTAVTYRTYDWKCFDEFDFNPFIRPEHIDKNCYFVTSPKFLRKVEERKQTNKCDLLYQLVLKKKHRYKCYMSDNILDIFDLPINERIGCWQLDIRNKPIYPKKYAISLGEDN